MSAAAATATAVPAGAVQRERLLELLDGRQIAPSLLAADYSQLAAHLQQVLDAGARVIHFDVMDGHFVPPITFGAIVIDALSEQVHEAGSLVDVHLMVERPERQIEQIATAGADLITVHAEATPNLHYALGAIRDAGCLAGVALNPGTPPEQALPVADLADVALCMTVNPGWGGQRFIEATQAKIARLRELMPESCAIEADGGIGPETAERCVALGASLLVAGSAVFGRPDAGAAFRELTARIG